MKLRKILTLVLILILFAQAAHASNIVLKIRAKNPSASEGMPVTLKTYLPNEIKLGDIIDKDDLDLLYDTEKGLYYVLGEYDLEAGGSVEREVEMKDIWIIPDNEIASLREETVKTANLLKRTEFEERANFLRESIELALNEIIKLQKNAPKNPQQHISNYRENIQRFEKAKQDLMRLRSLLSQIKLFPTLSIWKIFFSVVGFLTLLTLVLYFVWYRQAQQTVPTAMTDGAAEVDSIMNPEQYQSSEDDFNFEDIEKMMDDKN